MTKIFPADKLKGVKLEEGWIVGDKIEIESTSGGNYSTCYIVEKGDEKGFLKAFDYRDLTKPGGKAQFDILNSKFEREKKIVQKCTSKGIPNVVKFITAGQHYFVVGDINECVNYFILEYSKDGDIQQCISNNQLTDLITKFKCLSNIFDGVESLHSHGIMHLDIKPTNLVHFMEQRLTKITDFGSARQWIGEVEDELKDDTDSIITTRMYAPPEFLYEEPCIDWHDYRKKVDLYLTGNVVVKLFTNMSFTALLKKEITEQDSWDNRINRGNLKQLLDSLVKAASEVYLVIEDRIRQINSECGKPLNDREIDQIMNVIKNLCNPNPALRGHPKELKRINISNGLYRYRDQFIMLAKRSEYKYNTLYKLSNGGSNISQ